jgi:hemolysin activation/secretion protein
VAFPVPLVGLATAVEASAGTSAGSVPAQSLWYLGGPASLRGYAGAAAVGEAFWRARVDLASQATGARLTLFGDAAWAGPRAAFADNAPFAAKPLLAWGVGASFLDGLIRLDVARGLRRPAGWRVDLYWDGAL